MMDVEDVFKLIDELGLDPAVIEQMMLLGECLLSM
jgi:hypothetical protein